MAFKSYKNESRVNWGAELCEKQQISNDDIKLGAILRIADAAESMAKNHQQLIDERDRYKRWYESGEQTINRLLHRISGLQGYIKRIKKNRRK